MVEKTVVRTSCKSRRGACGVLVMVENGQNTCMEGNPDGPPGGAMGSQGQAAVQEVYNPNRLNYPLKRTGKRGEGRWPSGRASQ